MYGINENDQTNSNRNGRNEYTVASTLTNRCNIVYRPDVQSIVTISIVTAFLTIGSDDSFAAYRGNWTTKNHSTVIITRSHKEMSKNVYEKKLKVLHATLLSVRDMSRVAGQPLS